MYVSEFTQFMNEMHEKKPTLDAEQRLGRAIFWDQPPIAPDSQIKLQDATIAQQPYVYQIKG